MYDYGTVGNLERYHSMWAPVIPLNNIKQMPIALFVGEEDDFGTPKDSEWLKSQLGDRCVHYELIPDFDHEAFLCGRNMDYMQTALGLVKQYNPLPSSEELNLY